MKLEIVKPLVSIFNLSFSSGVFPSQLKTAKVCPVFKKGSHLLLSNYRPISLLSNINKLLEKLMHSRLYKFLSDFNCIYSLQFGFRKGYSTNHALISITELLKNAVDNDNIAAAVFVDFQKAFDTVNHDIYCQTVSLWCPWCCK